MAQPADPLAGQIAQLNAARNLVLGDSAFYPQIVNGILPITGPSARLELRRWGAEFLAETFSSPVLASAQKEQLAPNVLQTIQDLLRLPDGDVLVLRHMVQTAACLYPLVFRHIINHPEDTGAWEQMTAIKQDILRKWDSFPYPVKICCIKFAQRVVQVQTHGMISDPRRPEQNETSLAIVPKNHSILALPHLEAEASGLLDRLLSVFQEEASDPLLVNATLNCLSTLIRSRQSVGNKIINAILNFYPAKQVRSPLTPATRVGVKSMERTARALFINIMKRNPNHPLLGKMQQYIDRLMQSRLEITDDASRKRGLPVEPTDGLDNAKRARLDAQMPPLLKIPPLPPGPINYQQLYSITEDAGLSSFDVKQLPIDLLVKIVVPLLARVDQSAMTQAIDAVRVRYETLGKRQAAERQSTMPTPGAAAAEEEDDDYEPEYQPMDAPEAAAEQADVVSTQVADLQPDLVSLSPFVLPQPLPLSEDEAGEIGRTAVGRIFEMMASTETASKPAKGKTQQQLGFSRLAGSTFDRDAWVILLTRLATRGPAGLEVAGVQTKKPIISDSIRESLYRYILEDFRPRVSIGVTWLNEEWYNDRVQMKFVASRRSEEAEEPTVPLHYDRWVLRLLDGFLPYLDARDTKIFIRFLSEIPEVTIPITQRVASLAKDPERVNLCVQSLLYLIMFRPPAREICLNALEDVYRTYEESRPAAGKILAKWRPHVTGQSQPEKPQQASLVTRPAAPGPSTGSPASNPAETTPQQQQQPPAPTPSS